MITYSEINERIKDLTSEMLLLPPKTERKRYLMAEIMTLETYPEFIMKSPNAIEFFETMKKEAAERGNLNHAAGLERVIKWIKEKHHGKL